MQYTVHCNEYILAVLKRAHQQDASIPLDAAKWNDLKPGVFRVELPFPLNIQQLQLLEREGARFEF